MSEVVDISAEMQALCAALGLEYDCVAEVVFRPRFVEAEVFLTNENGKKYIAAGTDKAAKERRVFRVRT